MSRKCRIISVGITAPDFIGILVTQRHIFIRSASEQLQAFLKCIFYVHIRFILGLKIIEIQSPEFQGFFQLNLIKIGQISHKKRVFFMKPHEYSEISLTPH